MTSASGRARALVLVAVPAVVLLLLVWAIRVHGDAPVGPDLVVHRWMARHRGSGVTSLAVLLTSTGTGPVPYVVAAIAGWTACPRSAGPGRETLAATAAVALLLAGQGVRTALMYAVGRPRPPVVDWAATAGGHAFPSGHTATAALAAGLIAWAVLRNGGPRPVVRTALAVCALWAVLVGVTRVYLGVHWPTDVLGGWLFAAAWLALTLPFLTRLADRPGVGFYDV